MSRQLAPAEDVFYPTCQRVAREGLCHYLYTAFKRCMVDKDKGVLGAPGYEAEFRLPPGQEGF